MGQPTNQMVSIVATHPTPSTVEVRPNRAAHSRFTVASSWAISKISILWTVVLQSLIAMSKSLLEMVALTNMLLPTTMSAVNEAAPSITNQTPSSRSSGEKDTAACSTADNDAALLPTSTAALKNTTPITLSNVPSKARMNSVLAALITATVIALLLVTTWQGAMNSWRAHEANIRTLDIRLVEIVLGPKNPTRLPGQKGGGTEL
ncbi:hypothetical protein FRB94_008756 [Tulasnella sp. JGI-2019a]|nr:hypothetical protein FRB94_008756 [Tulasnella sp. JGI-2019a]KAG9028672.1 hypothetical protein FRB95_006175 [Tulasnella sp. JGI-2019a]